MSEIEIPYTAITWVPRTGAAPCGFGGSGCSTTSGQGTTTASNGSTSTSEGEESATGSFIGISVLLILFALWM